MTDAALIEYSIRIAYAMLAVSLCLAGYRLYKGPDLTDRVTALDLMTGILMSFSLVVAVESGREAFVDVGLAVAVIGFLGTAALARLLERTGKEES
jgi:multicomponent Na+:H+ antiporter subunit F